jgi:starch-binding outer membrane protein, SusD/RagB family
MSKLRRYFFSQTVWAVLLCLTSVSMLPSCTLDPTNVNQVTEDLALTTRDGVFNATVGLQRFYATDVFPNAVLTSGVTSRELVVTRTFINLTDLEGGGQALPNDNSNILGLAQSIWRMIGLSNDIINAVPSVTTIPDSTRNGIAAIAHVHRAIALSYSVQYFTQTPVTIRRDERAVFEPSTQVVMDSALRSLALAESLFTVGNTPQLRLNVLSSTYGASGSGFFVLVRAIRARCHLIAGNYPAAVTAANAVDLTVLPNFVFDGSVTANTFFPNILNAGNTGGSYAARDSLGLPAALFDVADTTRRRFYQNAPAVLPTSAIPQFAYRPLAAFAGSTSIPIPMYRPIEMILIRAEARARQNDAAGALADINIVRTKVGYSGALNIGTVAAYTGPSDTASLFREIYKQRCVELYLSGLRLGDAKRLSVPGPAPNQPIPSTTRTRNFYPYPRRERDNNPNVPPDPQL